MSNSGGITIPVLKLQSHSNKNNIVLEKKTCEDQWNRIEELDMNLSSYAHLIFDKSAK
jgi:hypothetical protein